MPINHLLDHIGMLKCIRVVCVMHAFCDVCGERAHGIPFVTLNGSDIALLNLHSNDLRATVVEFDRRGV